MHACARFIQKCFLGGGQRVIIVHLYPTQPLNYGYNYTLCRSPDLIVEVAHPSITADHGRQFLEAADFMASHMVDDDVTMTS